VSIETVTGSNFNDDISAVFFFGTLNGANGNDSLYAGATNGTLNGGAGNDSLVVDDFFGTLNGGDGNDVLEVNKAQAGVDSEATVNGGAGSDFINLGSDTKVICDYNAVSDSPAGAGRDTIVGFHGEGTSQGDQIDLRDIYPGTLIWGGPWTAGHVRYVGGVVQVNTDSDAAAEFEIQVVGAPALFVQAGHPGSDILL
jgi:Ca2+-binding RTX toxin-like protein